MVLLLCSTTVTYVTTQRNKLLASQCNDTLVFNGLFLCAKWLSPCFPITETRLTIYFSTSFKNIILNYFGELMHLPVASVKTRVFLSLLSTRRLVSLFKNTCWWAQQKAYWELLVTNNLISYTILNSQSHRLLLLNDNAETAPIIVN